MTVETDLDLAAWLAGGERIPIRLDSWPEPRSIFRRMEGSGPSITFLHGFPTSSWDWSAVTRRLRGDFRALAFDFLGFGDSDKPRAHRYDLLEQADLVEAMWAASGPRETVLVAHDYGVSVARELLARRAEGRLAVHLRGAVLLNGILYEELHRPLAIQRLLLSRVTGPLVTRLVRERDFARSFARIFSAEHPLDPAESRQHWQAIERHGGPRIYHRLIQYLRDARRHGPRWRDALHRSTVRTRFVWGLQDPVTGRAMIDELRRHLPAADVLELDAAGHYPQIEVPDQVAGAVRDLAARATAPQAPPSAAIRDGVRSR
jgi:pimeloyl-ACP methyl ester carboxylesterase